MKKILPILIVVILLSACNHQTKEKEEVEQEPEKVVISATDSLKIAKKIKSYKSGNDVNLMEAIFGKPKFDVKTIGILVYNGVNGLDLMGPRYVFGNAMGVKIKLIPIKPGNIKTVMGVEIVPNTVIDSVSQLDILIIPGGFTETIKATYNKELLKWIRKIDKTTIYTGAVCTGGWILGATGLLENKRASTNWYRNEEFLKKYGAIPTNQRYTQDGKYWTSTGVTAAIDMSLAIMKDIYGSRYAQAIMLDMEYAPHPPIEGGTPEKTNWAVNWMMNTI